MEYSPDLTSPSVLIAVSEPQELYLLRRYARQCGWNALYVGLGRYVVPAAQRERPYLVILDAQLPDLPGGNILQALKSSTLTQQIPVICTAYDSDCPTALQKADGYLKKPVLYEDFSAALQCIYPLHDQQAGTLPSLPAADPRLAG